MYRVRAGVKDNCGKWHYKYFNCKSLATGWSWFMETVTEHKEGVRFIPYESISYNVEGGNYGSDDNISPVS